MSRGAGIIERRIAELFAATRDRALTIDDITDHAFKLRGAAPTRAQRLSATRAAHRLLRRVRKAYAKHCDIVNRVHDSVRAELGLTETPSPPDNTYEEYEQRIESHPEWAEHNRLYEFCERIGVFHRHVRAERRGYVKMEADFWCASTVKGRLWFHPPDVPVQVWAVSIQPAGVIWAEAEVTKVTERNVIVRYRGDIARLDRRKLWYWWAWWRGVMFVSSRTGRIASTLDAKWQDRYGRAAGGVPPVLQMPLADAMALLGVPADYSKEDVLAAFRREAKKAHPDAGGTAKMFRRLVEARDRLLAAIGTTAPPPKPPSYMPKGVRVIYRSGRAGSSRRLGATTRLLGS